MDFSNLIDELSEKLPELMQSLTANLSEKAVSVDPLSSGKFLLLFMVVILGAALLARFLLGQGSNFNRTLSISVEILAIYIVTIVIYILRPWHLDRFLSPLPFATFCSQALILTPFHGTAFSTLCSEILGLVILSLLVHISCWLFHSKHGPIRFFLSRIGSVVLALFLHLAANWAIKQYLPALVVQYAPAVLLVLLLSFLFMGLFKWLLGFFLAALNPLLGVCYAFFFSNTLGKMISLSVLSTAVCCCVFYLLESTGYTVICITPKDLISYVPLALGLTLLWYLIGNEL